MSDVTHVFLARDENNMTNIRAIQVGTFYNCTKLKYFDFVNGLYTIRASAFFNVNNLEAAPNLDSTLMRIEQNAFTSGFTFQEPCTLILGGSINSIGNAAFSYLNGDVKFDL